jgi:hypothetical protein
MKLCGQFTGDGSVCGEELVLTVWGRQKPLLLSGIERRFFGQPASSVVTIVTELVQFHCFTNRNAVDFET